MREGARFNHDLAALQYQRRAPAELALNGNIYLGTRLFATELRSIVPWTIFE